MFENIDVFIRCPITNSSRSGATGHECISARCLTSCYRGFFVSSDYFLNPPEAVFENESRNRGQLYIGVRNVISKMN